MRLLQWAWRGWPVLAVAAGLLVTAACLIYPQVEENRELLRERQRLEAELARVQSQIEANTAFLRQARDPGPAGQALRQRLAERQLRVLPAGAEPIALPGLPEDPRSPFHLILAALVAAERPTAVAGAASALNPKMAGAASEEDSSPWGGRLAGLFGNERSRLYLLAAGLMLLGTGLICDAPRRGRVMPWTNERERRGGGSWSEQVGG